jgi:hypothetical protein
LVPPRSTPRKLDVCFFSTPRKLDVCFFARLRESWMSASSALRRVRQMEWSVDFGKFGIRFGPRQEAEGEDAETDSQLEDATECEESFAVVVIEEIPPDVLDGLQCAVVTRETSRRA